MKTFPHAIPNAAICLLPKLKEHRPVNLNRCCTKRFGQLVLAIAKACKTDWQAAYVLAVHGETVAAHLQRASVLATLGISALHIESKDEQVLLFCDALLPKLLSGELRVPADLGLLDL